MMMVIGDMSHETTITQRRRRRRIGSSRSSITDPFFCQFRLWLGVGGLVYRPGCTARLRVAACRPVRRGHERGVAISRTPP